MRQCLLFSTSASRGLPIRGRTATFPCQKQFLKHDYRKKNMRRISVTEDFDSQGVECWGTVLDSAYGESLGVSVLLDSKYCHQSKLY